MEKKLHTATPLEPMDMHAPIEVTIAVRMKLPDGGTGRLMFETPPGRIPTRAEIKELIATVTDPERLAATPLENGIRPMTKPEFVELITKRATGEAIPMAGDQHFVPAPCEIPHAMLVHAICGAFAPNMLEDAFQAELDAKGLIDPDGDWRKEGLDKQPDDVLLAIYQRVTA